MNGGILLALAGIWVGCQVFGGNALERLGIVGDGKAPSGEGDGDRSAGEKVGGLLGGGIPGSGGWLADQLLGGQKQSAGEKIGGAVQDGAEAVTDGAKKIADVLGGWVP